MKKYINLLCSAFLAGICVSIGGAVYLVIRDTFAGSKVVGALFYSVGLFIVCTRGYHLFTSKAYHILDNRPSYILDLLTIWIGNLLGCMVFSAVLRLTRMSPLRKSALEIINIKTDDSYLSLFILGIICNILIFIGVEGYAKNPHSIGKYLNIILGVSVFALFGAEHSVADMFYWSLSGRLYSAPIDSFIRILVVTFGNMTGGILFKLIDSLKEKLNTEKTEAKDL